MRLISLFAGLGGGFGALARYTIEGWASSWSVGNFPWGTLAVNLIGSALLGWLMGCFHRVPVSPGVQVMLTAGFCGGLTTFSTFSYQTFEMISARMYATAAAYAICSLAACVAGAAAGYLSIRPPAPDS